MCLSTKKLSVWAPKSCALVNTLQGYVFWGFLAMAFCNTEDFLSAKRGCGRKPGLGMSQEVVNVFI